MTTHLARGGVALVALALLASTGVTQLTASAEPVAPRRYIVETSSGPATSRQVDRLRRVHAPVTAQYSKVLNGYATELTARQLRTVRADPTVTSVTPDTRISIGDTPEAGAVRAARTVRAAATSVPWGLDRIDQRATKGNGVYRYDTTGKGVTAFIVDTGIRFTHSEFGGRAKSGYDFVGHDSNASDCTNGTGHGTHVAGTVGGSTSGVAKKVTLVSLRVLDCNGDGDVSDFIAALDWAVKHKGTGPAVVNFSAGGEANSAADEAVKKTIAAGISVVIAAGNESVPACEESPGRVPAAVTVGASDVTDTEAYFSNYGSCVDLFAPGVDIRSAGVSSDTAHVTMSGTSMSTPHVTGAVARYLQSHPTATPAAVQTALVRAATPNVLELANSAPNRLLFVGTRAAAYAPTRVRVTQRGARARALDVTSGRAPTGGWTGRTAR